MGSVTCLQGSLPGCALLLIFQITLSLGLGAMIVMIMKAKVSNSTKSDQHWNGRFLRNAAFLIAYLTQLKKVQNVET